MRIALISVFVLASVLTANAAVIAHFTGTYTATFKGATSCPATVKVY